MNSFMNLWNVLAGWLAASVIAPSLVSLNLTTLTDSPAEIADFFMLTVLQVSIIAFVLRPLEYLFPVEKQPRSAISIDRSYTLLKLLGLTPLFTFLILVPVSNWLGGAGGSDEGFLQIDKFVPWFKQHQVLLFLTYFLIYDFTLYLVHRLQHAVPWWWMLHSLHHSQRHLNCWTNDRDSFVDDFLEAVIFRIVAMLIGASPTEYAGVILIGQLLESLSHTNVRISFGNIFDKVFVDPRYHRLHHMLDDPEYPGRQNCNFSFIFPLWDILFGTARYHEPLHPCGVSDPLIDADNSLGLWAQQWAVVKRFWNMLAKGVPSTV
jgi:sterol desaturase/sphingolipid hydroxylase (fatty acid hydroxylase superfamily)